MTKCGEMVSLHERDSSGDKPCVLDRGHTGECSISPRIDYDYVHYQIMEYGLRQLEWDRGGQFVDSNRVVDRHNREIIIAYELGRRSR